MSYKVIKPYVIVASADGVAGDFSGGYGAVVPAGHNDERCETLVDEGFLEKVKDEKPAKAEKKSEDGKKSDDDSKPTSVKDILAAVGSDKAKAQEFLDAENAAEKPRVSLVADLEKVLAAEAN